MSTKTALVLLAKGVEELECITAVNVLRRGNIKVTLAGVCGLEPVKGRSDITIVPDVSLRDVLSECYDVVVLPGGLVASKILSESSDVGQVLKGQEKTGKLIAAICAAPLALKAHSIAYGKHLTSYPAMEADLRQGDIYTYETQQDVVVDGNLITSRGPATALPFAFAILEKLSDTNIAKQVAIAMLYDNYK